MTAAPEPSELARSPAPKSAEPLDLRALVRLLQLASPALPIGGYSYSEGLESMIDRGEITDENGVREWIADLLECVIAVGDAPIVARLCAARASGDSTRFLEWSAWYRASREARELRAQTEQTGGALLALAGELGILDEASRSLACAGGPLPLPAAFALAAHGMHIECDAAIAGYVMSWLENQVLVAIKTVPLGQVAGQRLLYDLAARVPQVVARARVLPDDLVASFAPGFALASMRHETQYSRLFRS